MDDWAMVQWSQARQITDILGWKGQAAPRFGTTPAACFADLKASDRGDDAIAFMGLALPRYEAIVWAADVLARFGNPERDLDEMRAFEIARQWIGSPSDSLRRRCFELADALAEVGPEKLLLLAIFLSGGSIAPEDLQPVHPREELTGRLAGAVVLLTVSASPDRALATGEALAMGDKMARRVEA
jgi:hypothetical protein